MFQSPTDRFETCSAGKHLLDWPCFSSSTHEYSQASQRARLCEAACLSPSSAAEGGVLCLTPKFNYLVPEIILHPTGNLWPNIQVLKLRYGRVSFRGSYTNCAGSCPVDWWEPGRGPYSSFCRLLPSNRGMRACHLPGAVWEP